LHSNYNIQYGYINTVDDVVECFIHLSKDQGLRMKNLFSVYIFMEAEIIEFLRMNNE